MTQIDVSALEAELEEAPPASKPGQCTLQTLVAEHPEAEAVLRRAIADVRRSASVTARILTRNGLKISESAVKRHRQGVCVACKEGSSK